MTEWSAETYSPIISSDKCCADVNSWLILILYSAHNALCALGGSQKKKTAIISLYSINLSVSITEAESVYSAVRTGSLNQVDTVSSLKGYTY